MKKLRILPVVALLCLTIGSCVGAEKSEHPLSPSVAGPIPGVNITPPTPMEPRDGASIAVDQQPVTLLLQNAETNGQRPLSYVFDVATDIGFTNKVFTREGIVPGGGGRTALRLPEPLASARSYYWRATAMDGANTGPPSPAAHFRIFTPIVIERPRPESPTNNTRIDSLHPEFKIGNAPRSGPVGDIRYVLELSDTDSFANKIAVWTFAEQSGQTRFDSPHDLVGDEQFFWRVRAFETNTNATGPWSDTEVFRTAAPAPLPGPGGGGSPGTPCGPPYPNQPFGIVQCRRNQYDGHMSSSEIVSFLRGVAKDLNAAGIAGGPFGILRKSGGHNCEGYSCDLICSSRNLWDVLIDSDGAQTPTWGDKNDPPGQVCEIQ